MRAFGRVCTILLASLAIMAIAGLGDGWIAAAASSPGGPVPWAPPPAAAADAISAGYVHTCALTSVGGVKCWGDNDDGQLGDGTTKPKRPKPTDVVGLQEGVQQVVSGEYHACALTTSGGVKCWGNNDEGQLGDGTRTLRRVPVDVVGLQEGVKRIASGGWHTCAITEQGAAKCWGSNDSGQLGDGTTKNRLTPVPVKGLQKGVKQISAGLSHTCAITAKGAAKCWGRNDSGGVGDGTTKDRLKPVKVKGLQKGVQQVVAGNYYTCAVTTKGAAKCWGANWSGQLGDGTTKIRLTPVKVKGLQKGVMQISLPVAWSEHSCVATTDGRAKCWGENVDGQLGDGTTKRRLKPVRVKGLQDVKQVSAGGGHTCAVTTSGGAKCWGFNRQGQLGNGTRKDSKTPVDVFGLTGVAP